MTNESVVYVIGNADNHLVKIGTTTKGKLERLGQIQTMSPSILTVLWTTPGDREFEHKLHYRFRAERRHGEWFDFDTRDAVAEIKRAAIDLGASLNGPPMPTEALWNGVNEYVAWLRYGASTEERCGATADLADLAEENASLLESLASDVQITSAKPLLAEVIGAFQLAHQRLRGIDYADSVGPASPRATIALASNMAWLAECAAGIIEDDSLIVYSPQLAAEFARHAARAVGKLGEALARLGESMRDAGHRGEVAPSLARTFGSIPDMLTFAAEDLAEASGDLSEARYVGFVARAGVEMSESLYDELAARNLDPSKRSGTYTPIVFYYQEAAYSLAWEHHDWVLEAPSRHGGSVRLPLGFADGAANHPAQVVNHALDLADSLLGLYDPSSRRRDQCATLPRDARGDVSYVPDDPEVIRTRQIDKFLDRVLDSVLAPVDAAMAIDPDEDSR